MATYEMSFTWHGNIRVTAPNAETAWTKATEEMLTSFYEYQQISDNIKLTDFDREPVKKVN